MSRRLRAPLPSSDDTSVSPLIAAVTTDPATRWQALFGSSPPERMPAWIAQAVAWKEQALEQGDVAPHIQRDLRIIAADAGASRTHLPAKPTDPSRGLPMVHDALSDLPTGASCIRPTRKTAAPLPTASSQLLPGTRLVKSHGGKTHVVEVTVGGMLYDGVLFASLSAVAKAITGTHWNGLLFFGLRKRKTYPARVA